MLLAMHTLQIVYPSLLDIGCYSHTMDHVGEHCVTPTLEEFAKAWVNLFAHSPKAQLLWRERTATYSETRWWSRWEVLRQVMLLFGDVAPFLQGNELAQTNHRNFFSSLDDPHKKCLS